MSSLRRTENDSRWAEIIDKQKESGLTQTEWCRQHNISVNTLRYHIRRIRKLAPDCMDEQNESHEDDDSTQFVQLLPSTESSDGPLSSGRTSFIIRTPGFMIEVSETAPPKQLTALLEAISHA
ncbi:MAG: hypothetical protein PUG95_02040 [Firmicutes bacterium]|nr:hypothetical protein [Bacillota bacterium]